MFNKRLILIIFTLFCFSILQTSTLAIQTQSLTDVSWEDLPENITELTNFSLKIDFDFTASSLQNYTIQTSGVTILKVENPGGCTISENNITCPSSLEPTISVRTNAIDIDSIIPWIVYTNDLVDGEEIWNLNLSMENIIDAPQLLTRSFSNFSIFPTDQQIEFNFSYQESNYSLDNATLNYLVSNNHVDMGALNEENTEQLIFNCNNITKYCSTTINTSELMNLSNEEYFFNSYIQIYDIAGNRCNESQINFFLDQKSPVITTESPVNSSKTNNETILFTAFISDNSLDINSLYIPEFNCSLNLNNTITGYNTSSSDSISFEYNISTFSEDNYNWSFSCFDLGDNFNISNTALFITDLSPPNITGQDTSSVSSSTFTIIASSSEESKITVYYSTNQSLINETYQNASKESDTSYSINPSLTLTSLSASTTYYYKIQLCDEANNCAISDIYDQTTSVTSSSSSSSSGGGSRISRSSSITSTDDKTEDPNNNEHGEIQLSIENPSDSGNNNLETNNDISNIKEESTAENNEINIRTNSNNIGNLVTGANTALRLPTTIKNLYGISLLIFGLFLLLFVFINKSPTKISPVKLQSKNKNVQNVHIDTNGFGNWFELESQKNKLKKKIKAM